MKKLLLLLLTFLTISQINAQLVHPGASHKMSDLERMKSMVELGKEPWASEYTHLSSVFLSKCDYEIKGDGRAELLSMGEFGTDGYAAYYNALMWVITGDECHAQKCVEIFNAWTNLKRVPNTFALTNGRYVWKMCEGAEIIKHTYNGWSAVDQKAFGDMLVYPGWSGTTVPTAAIATRDVSFYWNLYQGDPVRYGNQGLFAYRSLIAMAIFLDNEIMYDRVVRYLQGLPHRPDDLAYPSGPPNANNNSPSQDCEYIEERGTNGLGSTIEDYGYNEVIGHYIWENGQCQEAARDQVHTGVGLHILSCIAEIAWNQGDDLYGHLDNRILDGFEYFYRYNVGANQFSAFGYPDWNPTVASGEFISRRDRSDRFLSKAINPHVVCNTDRNTRGNDVLDPYYEIVFGHYKDRLLLSESDYTWVTSGYDIYTSRVGPIETVSAHNEVHGWGGLKFRRVSPGDPISGFDSQGLPIFSMPTIPATVEAEHYDYFQINGNERVYYDTGAGNRLNFYRTDEDVDIRYFNDTDASDGYVIDWIDSGEWLTYTVNVETSGYYNFLINYSSITNQNNVNIYVSNELVVDGVNLPNQSDALNFTQHLVGEGVYLEAGVHPIKIEFTGGSNSMRFNSFTIGNNNCKNNSVLATNTIEAESFCDKNGLGAYSGRLVAVHEGDWAKYGIDFGTEGSTTISLDMGSTFDIGATVSVILDDLSNTPIANVAIPNTGSNTNYNTVYAELTSKITGVHIVYLLFNNPLDDGSMIGNVDSFMFYEDTYDCVASLYDAYTTIEAENYCDGQGIGVYGGGTRIGSIYDGNWVKYGNVNFGSSGINAIELSAGKNHDTVTYVDVYLDSISSSSLTTVNFINTGGVTRFTSHYGELSTAIKGVHDVYLIFSSDDTSVAVVDIDSFTFLEDTCSFSNYSITTSIEVEDYCEMSGIQLEDLDTSGNENIGYIHDGDWLRFSNFDFGSEGANALSFSASTTTAGGTIELRSGSITGTLLTSVDVSSTGDWSNYENFEGTISDPVTGVHDLYVVFTGGSGYLFNIDNFMFSYSETLSTSNFNFNDLGLSVYPNPVVDYLHISTQVESIQVRDLTGRVLISVTDETNVVNVSSLSSGVYFVEIGIGSHVQMVKFFKE